MKRITIVLIILALVYSFACSNTSMTRKATPTGTGIGAPGATVGGSPDTGAIIGTGAGGAVE